MVDSLKLLIEDDEGKRSVVPIDLDEVSIGRTEGSIIRLNERNISRNHARIVLTGEQVFAEDLDSYNGVFINGLRVKQRQELLDGDLMRIGDFHLELRGEGLQRRMEETTQRTILPPTAEPTEPGLPPMAASTIPNIPLPQIKREESDVSRAEPTAIIRLDQRQALEDGLSSNANAVVSNGPRLVCVSTNLAGRVFEINQTEVVIGRTRDNDIAIDHRSVSRHHAKLSQCGNDYEITDLQSANGTLVNDEQYAKLSLKQGDLVELGHVKFRFVPSGQTYQFTQKEQAAIDAAAANHDATGVSHGPTSFPVRSHSLVLIAVTSVAVCALILMGWVLFFSDDASSTNANGQPVRPLPRERMAHKPAKNNHLIEKTREYMIKRDWAKAHTLIKLVIEKNPDSSEAFALLRTIEMELTQERLYGDANTAIRANQWDIAWNALAEIDPTSVYHDDCAPLRKQVRGAMIAQRTAIIRDLIESGNHEEAVGLLAEIEALDPNATDLEALRLEVRRLNERSENTVALQAHRPVKALPRRVPSKAETKVKQKPKPKSKPRLKERSESLKSAQEPNARDLYNNAVSLLRSGKTESAIDNLTQCIKSDRNFCLCYRALGIAYTKVRNTEKAVRYYRLYVKTCPNAQDAETVRKMLAPFDKK